MLSKNKLKYIHSLSLKKHRDIEEVFVAEGPKIVGDLMGHFPCRILLGTADYLVQHPQYKALEFVEVEQRELEQASFLKTPRDVMAVFSQKRIIPQERSRSDEQFLELALDGVQDPGNLGTIIRLADWYGIENIYCSKACADVFSPKVIQATMGAIARVKVSYVDLVSFLEKESHHRSVFGTFLDGEDLYTKDLGEGGILVMGNEGQGISKEIASLVNQKLYIPNYPKGQETSESLNVAVATAIACAEIRRQSLTRNQ